MKLKTLYERIRDKIFSVGFLKKIYAVGAVKKLFEYEVFSYLVFGVLTTAVNLLATWVCAKIIGDDYAGGTAFTLPLFGRELAVRWVVIIQAAAWFASVVFAYFTNKIFVFESRSWKPGTVAKEILSFLGARLLSFVLFEELMTIGVQLLLIKFMGDKAAYWTAKLITAVFNVVFNYIVSKLVIFRRKKPGAEAENG